MSLRIAKAVAERLAQEKPYGWRSKSEPTAPPYAGWYDGIEPGWYVGRAGEETEFGPYDTQEEAVQYTQDAVHRDPEGNQGLIFTEILPDGRRGWFGAVPI